MKPPSLQAMREHAEFVFLRCPDGKTISSDMLWMIGEVERLRAIVATLPVTADGIPIIHGMTLWESYGNGSVYRMPDVRGAYYGSKSKRFMVVLFGDRGFNSCDVKMVFSTEQAARAAKGGG